MNRCEGRYSVKGTDLFVVCQLSQLIRQGMLYGKKIMTRCGCHGGCV